MQAMTSPLGEGERGLPPGSRQSKSTDIERELGLSGWDVTDDEELLRPATALASLSVPTKTAKPSSRGGGRRASITPVSTKHVEPNDGWGDPDAIVNHTNQEWEDTGVVQPPQEDSDAVAAALQRRGSRIEALARHSGKPRTAYAKEPPPRQVLRQRMLAVMQLAPPEAVPPDAAYSPLKSVLKKPLGVSQHQRDCIGGDDARLPTITKSTVPSQCPSIVSRGTGLFGPHVEDSLEMREQLVQRFLPVWSLLPSRSKVAHDKLRDSDSRPSTRGSSPSDAVARDTKSPFECSMLLTKICKAVGISLAASPPPDVWRATAKRRSSTTATAFATSKLPHIAVDLETFSEFVVRNALQPAMHHFRLDRDATEYFLTLDAVVHSLVTRVDEPEPQRISPWRLRELGELQPVLPLWKKGMQFAPKQPPLVKTSPTAAAFLSVSSAPDNTNEAATMVYSVALSGGDVGVVPPSELGLSLQSKKLSAYEAKAMQDANIRRKMQLRNSWQPRIVVSELLPQQQQALQPSHPATPFGRAADAAHGASSSSMDHSCIRGEGVLRPSSHDTPLTRPGISSNNQVSETLCSAPEDLRMDEARAPALPLLLCGSCPGEQEASLWCSACFAVFCTACWTATHHSTVDLSAVKNQHDQHLPAPTARPMRTQRDHLAPPVAMVYLPTKPVANGKLKRGPSMVLADTNQLDDVWTGSGDLPGEDPRLLTNALSSHAILPAIKPPRQKPGVSKHANHHRSAPTLDPTAPPSAMDSTANLLKALMLGTASSASVLGSTMSLSPWSISSETKSTPGTVRVSQEPTKRKKLHPKAVTLDANALFP